MSHFKQHIFHCLQAGFAETAELFRFLLALVYGCMLCGSVWFHLRRLKNKALRLFSTRGLSFLLLNVLRKVSISYDEHFNNCLLLEGVVMRFRLTFIK